MMNKAVGFEFGVVGEMNRNHSEYDAHQKRESCKIVTNSNNIASVFNKSGNFSVTEGRDILSLKELCNLLISSFCGILDELGLETQEDEELLLFAIDSGDTDTVRDYVKLLRNKLSSVLVLRDIESRGSRVGTEERDKINDYMECTPLGNVGVNECYFGKDECMSKKEVSVMENVSENYSSDNNLNDKEAEYDLCVFNSDCESNINSSLDSVNCTNSNYLFDVKVDNSHKKSPVPPLRVEFAGPGSWNKCQLPNEYPTD